MKLFAPPELNPPGLNGATGGAALLNAAILSLKEPPLGFSDTGGGTDLETAGAGLGAAGGETSAGLGAGTAATGAGGGLGSRATGWD